MWQFNILVEYCFWFKSIIWIHFCRHKCVLKTVLYRLAQRWSVFFIRQRLQKTSHCNLVLDYKGPFLSLQSFLEGLRSQNTLLDTTFHSNTVCQTASTVSATLNRFQSLILIKYSSEVLLELRVLKSMSSPSAATYVKLCLLKFSRIHKSRS